MTELESLFLVVLLIYLYQCIYWVPPGAAVFALDFRGRGKRRLHGFRWDALKTEGFLAWPLPPLTPLTVAAWPAFEVNPEAMSFRDANGEWVTSGWDQLVLTASESKLRANGGLIFQGREGQVLELSELLKRLQRADKRTRARMIESWLGNAMRASAASRRIQIFAGRSRLLRFLANVQLVFLFVVVPLMFGRMGPEILWRLALFLLGMQVLITLEFWTVHKKLFGRPVDARLKSAVTILLSPMAAIRACDVLARDLFAGWHPLAASSAVLPAEEFTRFAGEQLRQWRFDDHHDSWYQETVGRLMDRAIRQAGARPETLLLPAKRESGCVAYCPRCLAQYLKTPEACTDCGFERPVAFAGSAKGMRGAR
jgi:hypothetical protein